VFECQVRRLRGDASGVEGHLRVKREMYLSTDFIHLNTDRRVLRSRHTVKDQPLEVERAEVMELDIILAS
jgi:hypothetical protein